MSLDLSKMFNTILSTGLTFKKQLLGVIILLGIISAFITTQFWFFEDNKTKVAEGFETDNLINTDYYIWEEKLPVVDKLSTATTKQHVLINSYMSCGSRFTAQFFGHRNDSFYVYEPLWNFNMMAFFDKRDLVCSVIGADQACKKITAAQMNVKPGIKGSIYDNDVSNSSVVDVLTDALVDMYNCRFDRLLNVIVDKVQAEAEWGGPSWKEYRECVKTMPRHVCLERLESVCKKADHVVTKVLRITTGSLDKLMERVPNLKVLHLYRDPRAIINSRREWKDYPITDGQDNSKKLCDKMYMDFVGGRKLMGKFPDRLKFVFYEDLTSNVEYKAKELYKFLGMDASIVSFENANKMKKIANKAPANSKAAELEELRKKNNAFWWRQNLPLKVTQIVQYQCHKMFIIFNLTFFDDETKLHNFDISSMNLPKLFLIE